MKQFLIRLFLFIGFAGIFYTVTLLLFGTFAPSLLIKNFRNFNGIGYTKQRMEEAKKTNNIDVLIIGSSHAYRGYDPRIFKIEGLNAFNLGSSAQSPIQTSYLLHKYLDNLNPHFVIIDVYPYLLSIDGVESSIDLVSSGLIDYGIFKMAVELNNVKLYNNLIYDTFNNHLNFKKGLNIDAKSDKYISGGYVESYQSLKIHNPKTSSKLSLSPMQIEAFEKIISVLKTRKIDFVIVQAPSTKSKYNSFSNNSEIDKWLSGLGEYYNFNKILNLPDTMFYDDNHLNQYGVNVFNKTLLGILKKEKSIQQIEKKLNINAKTLY